MTAFSNDRAVVPSRTVRALTRHKIKSTESLFSRINDSLQPLKPEAQNQFLNSFTGAEIELLLAAFKRADRNSGEAIFFSPYEWIALASGKVRASDRHFYYTAISTLARPHWLLLDESNGKRSLAYVPAIYLVQSHKDEGHGQTIVTISPLLRQSFNSYYRLPLAPVTLLREAGLRKVSTWHVKALLYLFSRFANKTSRLEQEVSLSPLWEAAGIELEGVRRNCNFSRLRSDTERYFAALKKANVFEQVQNLGADHYRVKASLLFFRPGPHGLVKSDKRTKKAAS